MSAGVLTIVMVAGLLFLSQIGMTMAMAVSAISFIGVWMILGDITPAARFMAQAAADSISAYEFSVIPLFVFMGLLVGLTGLGRDLFAFANLLFRGIRGGLGLATIWANAAFAAITGISIASAAIFTSIAVPEMLRAGYSPRFAVGLVAGSSVLGMLIPPSLLFILFGILTEASIGQLFIAGIIPGLMLATIYSISIIVGARFFPSWIFRNALLKDMVEGGAEDSKELGFSQAAIKASPVFALILIVLGGLYGGFLTPTEAGGAGAFFALVIAILRRRLTPTSLMDAAKETANITASICFLIIAANFFGRVLALGGVPDALSTMVSQADLSLIWLLVGYLVVILLIGMIIDAASVILIVVPIALPMFLAYPDANLIWIGVLTVFAVEIGLLTPPLGVSVFVVKTCLPPSLMTLGDVFRGAAPFVLIMTMILILLVLFPVISLALL